MKRFHPVRVEHGAHLGPARCLCRRWSDDSTSADDRSGGDHGRRRHDRRSHERPRDQRTGNERTRDQRPGVRITIPIGRAQCLGHRSADAGGLDGSPDPIAIGIHPVPSKGH